MSAFGRDDGGGRGDGLLVRFFDVLHVDGVDLIDEPLTQRLERLDALVGSSPSAAALTDDAAEAQASSTSPWPAGTRA